MGRKTNEGKSEGGNGMKFEGFAIRLVIGGAILLTLIFVGVLVMVAYSVPLLFAGVVGIFVISYLIGSYVIKKGWADL